MYLKKTVNLVMLLTMIYTLFLIWILLFKMELSINAMDRFRSINLIPFSQSTIVNGKVNLKEIIYNIIIFIPLGVYISMLKLRSKKIYIIIPIFVFSLLIEALQYILSIGATDITDLLGNTLGGVLGMVIYSGTLLILKEKTNKFYIILSSVFIALFLLLLLIISIVN